MYISLHGLFDINGFFLHLNNMVYVIIYYRLLTGYTGYYCLNGINITHVKYLSSNPNGLRQDFWSFTFISHGNHSPAWNNILLTTLIKEYPNDYSCYAISKEMFKGSSDWVVKVSSSKPRDLGFEPYIVSQLRFFRLVQRSGLKSDSSKLWELASQLN